MYHFFLVQVPDGLGYVALHDPVAVFEVNTEVDLHQLGPGIRVGHVIFQNPV